MKKCLKKHISLKKYIMKGIASKGKKKGKGGSINKKLLINVNEKICENWIKLIDTNIFPGFQSNGDKDDNFKISEYIVTMERIVNEDQDDPDSGLSSPEVPDTMTKPEDWKCPDDVPRLYSYIVKYCRNKFKIPPESRIKIFIGKYMRLANTDIEPPSEDTVNRILFNLNDRDIYRLEPGPMLGSELLAKLGGNNKSSEILNKFMEPLESKNIYMDKNECFPMGPVNQSNYYIKLNPGREIRIPPKITGNVPIKGNNKGFSIKPRNYSRITIIVDIMVSTEMVSDIMTNTIKTMEENKDKIDSIRKDIEDNNVDMDSFINEPTNKSKNNSKTNKKRRRRHNKNNIVKKDDDMNEIISEMNK